MKEIRVAELRAEAPAGGSLKLQGVPIVYDKPTVINDRSGSYTEIIRCGALDNADLSDVRLFYNHDLNKVPLARTPKTMQLTVTKQGLEMSATLADTQDARSVHAAVERGDLDGMSFAFKVPAGGDKFDAKTRTREIFKIEKVMECSVVPFPAYPQTSVEARAAMQNDALRKQAIIACNQILMREV